MLVIPPGLSDQSLINHSTWRLWANGPPSHIHFLCFHHQTNLIEKFCPVAGLWVSATRGSGRARQEALGERDATRARKGVSATICMKRGGQATKHTHAHRDALQPKRWPSHQAQGGILRHGDGAHSTSHQAHTCTSHQAHTHM